MKGMLSDIRQGTIYVALFLLCLWASWGAYKLPIPHGEVMAAWFQGFGTVAAICMGIALHIRNERTVSAERANALARFLSQIADLGASAIIISGNLRTAAALPDARQLNAHLGAANELQRQFDKWSELPIGQWPSAALSVEVDSMARAFADMVSLAKEMWDRGRPLEWPTWVDMSWTERAAPLQERVERVSRLIELTLAADSRHSARSRATVGGKARATPL